MNRVPLGAAAILMVPAFAHAQQPAVIDRNDPEIRAALDTIRAGIDSARRALKIPGVSVAIVYDQSLLLGEGFGQADVATGIRAGMETVYRVGSVTKVFTALALMQLQDAGKLDIDDPIEKYLPEFKIRSRYPDARPPTFRAVSAHYSGLPIEPPLATEYQPGLTYPSMEEQLASLSRVEMIAPAMSEFSYSNFGYNVMGAAIERIVKRPYAEYVESNILRPLGMTSSGFALSTPMRDHYAVGYRPAAADGSFRVAPQSQYGMASGMLYSTASDLAKFLSLFFRDGPAGGAQVLGGSSLRLMTIPVAVSVDPRTIWRTGSAIGWTVGLFDREQINYKPGGTPGYSTIVMINYQKKLGVAVLANTETEPWGMGRLALQKLTPIVQRISERQRAAADAQTVSELNALVGRYVLADTAAEKVLTFRAYDVSVANNRLVMTVPERSATSVVYIKETPLDPFSPGVFRMAGGSFYGNLFTFTRARDGTLRLTWRGYTFVRTP